MKPSDLPLDVRTWLYALERMNMVMGVWGLVLLNWLDPETPLWLLGVFFTLVAVGLTLWDKHRVKVAKANGELGDNQV